jgi:hypothetical protein
MRYDPISAPGSAFYHYNFLRNCHTLFEQHEEQSSFRYDYIIVVRTNH